MVVVRVVGVMLVGVACAENSLFFLLYFFSLAVLFMNSFKFLSLIKYVFYFIITIMMMMIMMMCMYVNACMRACVNNHYHLSLTPDNYHYHFCYY